MKTKLNPQFLPCTIEDVQDKLNEVIKLHQNSEIFIKMIAGYLSSDNLEKEISTEELASLILLFADYFAQTNFNLFTLKARIDFLSLPEKDREQLISSNLP